MSIRPSILRVVTWCTLVLLLAAVWGTPRHVHRAQEGESSVCASCQLGQSPMELPGSATGVALALPPAAPCGVVAPAPRSVKCLVWAPKQGPP